MENLIFTVNAVLPLFVLIALGYVIRNRGWLPEGFIPIFNKFCFKIAIPCSLFDSALRSDIRHTFSPKLMAFTLISLCAVVALLWIFFPFFIKSRPQAGSAIQAAFRSNIALFGLPLALNLFGESARAPMAIAIAFAVPFYNIVSVVLLASFSGSGHRMSLGEVLKEILTNGLVVGSILGMVLSFLGLGDLPPLLSVPIEDLAACATPVAMISLGANFSFQNAAHNRYPLFLALLMKLVLLPAAVVPLAMALGFQGAELGAVYIMYAAPVSTSSYVMADSMGCDGELAGESVVLSTFFSAFSVFAGVLLMKSIGLI